MVQGSLSAGGAEKAMVSLLNTLPSDRFDVDLMLSSKSGLFYKQLPSWVNVIEQPFPFNCLSHKPKDWQFYIHHPVMWIKKVRRTWVAKHQHKMKLIQKLWEQWRDDIPCFEKEYDVAYGGQQGLPNYFVIDKVKANRKIVWIHHNYDNLGYYIPFDEPYFDKATIIATMSPVAKEVLQKDFPRNAQKVWFLENITNGAMIRKMSEDPIIDSSFVHLDEGINIISVGRLAPEKNFSRALEAGKLLRDAGIEFHWTVIGEGPEREALEAKRQSMGLDDNFSFLGLRANPYQYVAKSDMLVVSSNFEGRSIAIDEAQILGIPVITTNYPTAQDAVEDGQTGLICEMSPQGIKNAIVKLWNDNSLRDHICHRLEEKSQGNVLEIEKYYKAFEGK